MLGEKQPAVHSGDTTLMDISGGISVSEGDNYIFFCQNQHTACMIGEGDHSDATFLSTGGDNSVSEGDTYKTIA